MMIKIYDNWHYQKDESDSSHFNDSLIIIRDICDLMLKVFDENPDTVLQIMDLPRSKNEAIGIVRDVFGVDPEFAEQRMDIWLQQREGFTFQQKLMKELS